MFTSIYLKNLALKAKDVRLQKEADKRNEIIAADKALSAEKKRLRKKLEKQVKKGLEKAVAAGEHFYLLPNKNLTEAERQVMVEIAEEIEITSNKAFLFGMTTKHENSPKRRYDPYIQLAGFKTLDDGRLWVDGIIKDKK